MKMKFTVLLSTLILTAGVANAGSNTYDPGAAGQKDYTAATDGSGFATQDFKFNLSANVGLTYNDNSTAIAVGTWNTKGRNHFTGSSEGGSVAACGEPTTSTEAPDGTNSGKTIASLDATAVAGCQ